MTSGSRRFLLFNFRGYTRVSDSGGHNTDGGDYNDSSSSPSAKARHPSHAASTGTTATHPGTSRDAAAPADQSRDHSPPHTPSVRVPLFAYPLLVAAVFAVSSAATVFSLMPEVPAMTLAAWRLQLTSLFLGVGAAVQWRTMSPTDRSRTLSSGGWLAGSGACLAVHFGAWVWGLQHTSLTHSLLMVSATPLLLAALALLTGSPLSRGELGGTLLGLAGAVVLSVGATGGGEARVGLAGDMASLLASAVMVGYLSVGRRLRQWMPIFVYAFPVTGTAALGLTLAGLVLEPVTLGGAGSHGSLGWLARSHYLGWVVYLALGPGIVGHTGFNTLLRYLSPLMVALAFQMEPLVGSVIGWAAGVMQPPGGLTYGGGVLVVAATVWVTMASAARERAERAADAAAPAAPAGKGAAATAASTGMAMVQAGDGWRGPSGAAPAKAARAGDEEEGGEGGQGGAEGDERAALLRAGGGRSRQE